MPSTVPLVEFTHHADALRVWRPDRKQDAGNLIDCMHMRSQYAVGMAMPAFAEQVQIKVRELRRKTVGVMRDVLVMLGIAPHQVVTIGDCSRCAAPFEHVGVGNAFQAYITFGNRDLVCLWQVGANQIKVLFAVFAEHAERIMVACLGNSFEIVC